MPTILISELCAGSRITRADGNRLRVAIEAHWSEPEPVVLDFSGVRVASVSFFDESFGRLAKSHPLDELKKRLRVENIDTNDRDLLNSIVTSRARQHQSMPAETMMTVRKALKDSGVPRDVLERWNGVLLALYKDRAGISASPEVATRVAREKAAIGAWTLDLGHYQMALPRDAGAALQHQLDELGIEYVRRSLAREWSHSRRNRRAHADRPSAEAQRGLEGLAARSPGERRSRLAAWRGEHGGR